MINLIVTSMIDFYSTNKKTIDFSDLDISKENIFIFFKVAGIHTHAQDKKLKEISQQWTVMDHLQST